MANNYYQFSEDIEERKEVLDWIEERIAELREHGTEDEIFGWQSNTVQRDSETLLSIFAEEAGDLMVVAQVLAEAQRKFSLEGTWRLQGAATCSKPRPGEFGGDGAVVRRGRVHWVNTYSWGVYKELDLIREDLRDEHDHPSLRTNAWYRMKGGRLCPACGNDCVVSEKAVGPGLAPRDLLVFDLRCLACGATWKIRLEVEGYEGLDEKHAEAQRGLRGKEQGS